MATIDTRKNKAGKITGYRIRACVGRDEQYKQVWRTCTIARPEGLTPKKEEKEVKRIADEWEKAQKEEYERTSAKTDKAKITFSDFVRDHWWKDHVMDGSHTPSSISFYQNMSDDIVSYFGEKKKLLQFDAETVKKYIVYLQTEAKTKAGEPYSQTTIVRHYQTLRNILNFALRFGYLKDDPCKYLSVKDKPRQDAQEIDFLAPKDAQRYLSCLEKEPLYWRTLENVLITTGLRRGEVCGLQWGDIDKGNLTITVCRNVTRDADADNKIHIGTPKNKESRIVPISKRVEKLLSDLKEEREDSLSVKDEEGNIISKYTILPNGFVFCRDNDPYLPIYPTEPTRWQRKFVERNSLPKVSPHDLRHTAATLALQGGADLKQVQSLLGHSDPATTMKFYAGVTDEMQRRTVEGIESILATK